jgi:tRNA (mo5U34)-methyltransferase
MRSIYYPLVSAWPDDPWIEALCEQAEQVMRDSRHGDLPRWRDALARLPAVDERCELAGPAPRLGSQAADPQALEQLLMEFHPWRKGPLVLGGTPIDAEWRSDWKWSRVAPHIELAGHRVLDIGCGNGYFGLRMLAAGAEQVVGIDPTLVFVMQWLVCRHFSGELPNFVLPLGIEDLPPGRAGFDTVCSMGVLYHRKDPLAHLERLRSLMKKNGGTLVLETLVLPEGREHEVLVPPGRYARMRNVWAVPGTGRLLEWLRQSGFERCDLVDVTATTTAEQRSTSWMRFESLEQSLEPGDPGLTVEGHPAPVRAVVIASA